MRETLNKHCIDAMHQAGIGPAGQPRFPLRPEGRSPQRGQLVDVVEIDTDILMMVGPEFVHHGRVTLHQADALRWKLPRKRGWDVAWHDIHDDNGHLQILHAKLLWRYRNVCAVQGAWGFPRMFKRRWPTPLIGGRKRT